jgi:hypothetical protein
MNGILQKGFPFLLFLLIIIVLLELESVQICLLKALEELNIQYEDSVIIVIFNGLLIIDMHVF